MSCVVACLASGAPTRARPPLPFIAIGALFAPEAIRLFHVPDRSGSSSKEAPNELE